MVRIFFEVVPSSASQFAVPLEALVDDDFIWPQVALAADWAVNRAAMAFINIIAGSSSMIKTVDHVRLVNVWQSFLLQDLDVQVLRALELGFEISLAAFANVDVGDAVAKLGILINVGAAHGVGFGFVLGRVTLLLKPGLQPRQLLVLRICLGVERQLGGQDLAASTSCRDFVLAVPWCV